MDRLVHSARASSQTVQPAQILHAYLVPMDSLSMVHVFLAVLAIMQKVVPVLFALPLAQLVRARHIALLAYLADTKWAIGASVAALPIWLLTAQPVLSAFPTATFAISKPLFVKFVVQVIISTTICVPRHALIHWWFPMIF